jgi:putative transposase
MDETNIKVNGNWKYLYRAVDQEGYTIDFLLTARRDREVALRFFTKAIGLHGRPEKVTTDKSGSNLVALESTQEDSGSIIEIRQIKYLNNIVEHGHRVIKLIIRPMFGLRILIPTDGPCAASS